MSLATLKKSRGAAKRWCTRAANGLNALLDKDPVDLFELRDAIAEFDRRMAILDEAQLAVENELQDDDLEADIDDAVAYRAEVRKSRIQASRREAELDKVKANGDTVSVTDVKPDKSNSNVKLPRLELPKFSGTLTEWQTFWDKFCSLVDKSDQPVISKFTYLQSLLEGEAKAVIEGLAVTERNYEVACELLQERYGRKERIIFAHIQGLLNLSAPTQTKNTSRVSLLWKLQDEVLTHIRSLDALGIRGEEYGVFLTPVILSRLPHDIRMEWARDGEGKESDLEWLLRFLRREIERRERSETFKNVIAKQDTVADERRNRTPSGVALSAAAQKGCGICSKQHSTAKCWNITRAPMEERRQRIMNAGLCFRCLVHGHVAKGCSAKCAHCKGRHHELLCNKENKEQPKGDQKGRGDPTDSCDSETVDPKDSPSVTMGARTYSQTRMHTVFQTARVVVYGKKGKAEATMMFDSGSDSSYISSTLVRKIGPEWVTSQPMSYAAFGGGTSASEMRNVYKFNVKGTKKGSQDLKAVEVKVICAPMYRPRVPASALQSLGNLEFADSYEDSTEVSVDILIGLDTYWKFMRQGLIKSPEGIVAQETVFGWVVSGPWEGNVKTAHKSVSHQLLCLTDLPDSTIRGFWELEAIGITDKGRNIDVEDPVLRRFKETIEFREGRYEVSLPWKQNPGPTNLLDNEKLAKHRLTSLSRRLAKNPELEHRYNEAILEMEAEGIVRELSPEEKVAQCPKYYLAHHPVVRETSATTKVRPVFDASAAGYNNISLNDCLETGPSLVPSLVEILIRFRRWKVALTADVTKAFLQIRVREEDQNFHRFLWDCNGSVRTMKFLRVPFGNKSSPFLLNATITHHLAKYPASKAVKELQENLYVDDLLTGADTYEAVCELFQEAKEIMLEASMPLAKCVSNDEDVREMLFQEFGAKHLGSESIKILGLKWLTKEDSFTFEGLEIPTDLSTTKRVVLSFLARLYDPVGFLAPFTMVAKLLIQEIWRLGLAWDVEVPQPIHTQFCRWVRGLEVLRNWKIPRCYSSIPWTEMKGIELHAFGDASEKGYGSVVYARVPHENGTFDVSLVIARGRVAPLKKVTLPRLELLGALLTARLMVFVRDALQLPDIDYRCWTDSTVALGWIKGNPANWKPFVANRVSEIQELTNPSQWGHCSGRDNPADLVSRGVFAESLTTSKLWLEGPEWLACPFENGSNGIEIEQVTQVVSEERVNTMTVVTESPPRDTLEVARWGKFRKALRVVGWCLRFIANAKCHASRRLKGDLSFDEVTKAKFLLFKYVQQEAYQREIEALSRGKSVHKTSPLAKLDPYIGEDGLLRIKGRLQHSELSYEEKYPIILPKGHLAKLLIRFQHELLKHAGVDTVITSLRGTYWIFNMRRLMKTVKRECVACRKVDAPACNQSAAPLPDLRVQQAPPFTVVGLDYAGPLFCCDYPDRKLYILLFTCAVVRAIHLELTDSLSLPDFMLAFRRFSARRGLPSVLFSDNAKTFVGAEQQLLKYFGPASPKWQFILPRSPWWGGWWERLVRSVKGALKKCLGGRCLTKIELETTLLEVESCVNSRPLTFVGDEVESVNPLTPSHFLIGKNAGFQVQTSHVEEPVTPQDLSDREVVRQKRLDQFWSVWSQNYLRNLPPSVNKFRAKGHIQVGSVVLVREDNTPRMRWPLGLVTKMFPGRDGLVRSVELHTVRGSLLRPIQRLHDLEVNSQTWDGAGDTLRQSEQTSTGATYAETSLTDKGPSETDNVGDNPDNSTNRVSRAGRVIKRVKRLDL